jgi:TctA family transporter
VTLGLFAVAEMIEVAVQGKLSETVVASEIGVSFGESDTFTHAACVSLRGSCNIIGIIPGIGGHSRFFAYGHARQTEKTGSNLERAGGASLPPKRHQCQRGGALVPTVAFGIPGSAGMAILLGAFYIQGIKPGPDMLNNNLWLIFSMAWTVAIANILAAAVCMAFANRMARVALLPGDTLFPVVLILCGIGAYCTRNALGDLVVTAIFGFVGYAMKKYQWPRPVVISGWCWRRSLKRTCTLSLRSTMRRSRGPSPSP